MKKSFIVLSSVLLAAPLFAQSGAQNTTTQNPNTQSSSQSTDQQSTNQNQNQNANPSQNTEYQTQSQNQNESQSAISQESQANQKQKLSSLAARMINNTTEARSAVQQQNREEALMYIGRASEDLTQIRNEHPNHRTVPIFTEVSNVWVIGPVRTRAAAQGNGSQGQVSGQDQMSSNQAEPNQNGQWEQNQGTSNAANAANQAATSQANSSQGQSPCNPTASNQNQWEQNQGTSGGANGTATSSGAPALAVRQIRGRFTTISVDTRDDSARLQAAREAVENGDFSAANQALAAVQNSLITATVRGDLPLMTVRENLILAREAAKNGDHVEERAALQAASNALAEYASYGGNHAQRAEVLSSEVSNDSRTEVSTSQINGWWNQVSDWTAPAPPQG